MTISSFLPISWTLPFFLFSTFWYLSITCFGNQASFVLCFYSNTSFWGVDKVWYVLYITHFSYFAVANCIIEHFLRIIYNIFNLLMLIIICLAFVVSVLTSAAYIILILINFFCIYSSAPNISWNLIFSTFLFTWVFIVSFRFSCISGLLQSLT